MNVLLLAAAAAGVGLFLKKKQRRKALGEPGSNSTSVRGPVSGVLYAVTIGAAGDDGRAVHSVFGPDGALLLTFLQNSSGGNKSLFSQSENQELESRVTTALQDFGLIR